MKHLIEDSDGDQPDTLKVNEQFKAKFEHNKRRQLLEQGRLKYGDLVEAESSESSSESEDSQGDLVQPKFEKKFLEVITAIRAGDKSILTKTGDSTIIGEHVFGDDDFELPTGKVKGDKRLTLKDQIRKDAKSKMGTD